MRHPLLKGRLVGCFNSNPLGTVGNEPELDYRESHVFPNGAIYSGMLFEVLLDVQFRAVEGGNETRLRDVDMARRREVRGVLEGQQDVRKGQVLACKRGLLRR